MCPGIYAAQSVKSIVGKQKLMPSRNKMLNRNNIQPKTDVILGGLFGGSGAIRKFL
jgi:hypothetical protein